MDTPGVKNLVQKLTLWLEGLALYLRHVPGNRKTRTRVNAELTAGVYVGGGSSACMTGCMMAGSVSLGRSGGAGFLGLDELLSFLSFTCDFLGGGGMRGGCVYACVCMYVRVCACMCK